MAITMYSGSVPVFLQFCPRCPVASTRLRPSPNRVNTIRTCILQLRLAPDMFPFGRQVQQATAHADRTGPGRRRSRLPNLTDTARASPS